MPLNILARSGSGTGTGTESRLAPVSAKTNNLVPMHPYLNKNFCRVWVLNFMMLHSSWVKYLGWGLAIGL